VSKEKGRGGAGLEWFIGRRYLASRRGTRFLSLITLIAIGGVSVGVMALITVIAVMTGLQTDLRNKILSVNPHIWVMTYGEAMRMDEWPQVLARVRRVPEVVAAAPFVHTELGLRNRAGYSEAAILRGIDPGTSGPTVTAITDSLRKGGLLSRPTRTGLPPLVLGARLAERANILEGDTVTLISFQAGTVSPLGMPTPELARFEVVGSFQTGMYEYDNKFMYTTIPAAQKLANLGNSVTGIEVRVPEPMQAMLVGEKIRDRLGVAYRTDDWISMNRALFSALKLEKLAMGDHPPPDRDRGGVQHRLHPGDGGDRQDARDRDPQEHGDDFGAHPADLHLQGLVIGSWARCWARRGDPPDLDHRPLRADQDPGRHLLREQPPRGVRPGGPRDHRGEHHPDLLPRHHLPGAAGGAAGPGGGDPP
jgi:hypothetical protein